MASYAEGVPLESMRRKLVAFCLPLLAALVLAGVAVVGTSRAEPDDRVADARKRVGPSVRAAFVAAGLSYPPHALYLRVFKQEGRLEMWGAKGDGRYAQVATYPVCAQSGKLGPKRTEGDEQVPEGLYGVRVYNARSRYHLSLGIDYPNASDRVLGKAPLGGDIMIHGGCVTIGCVPLGDAAIEEVFLAAADTHAAGAAVDVHLFPAELTDEKLAEIAQGESAATVAFWRSLRPAYQRFEETRRVARGTVDAATGLYVF